MWLHMTDFFRMFGGIQLDDDSDLHLNMNLVH